MLEGPQVSKSVHNCARRAVGLHQYKQPLIVLPDRECDDFPRGRLPGRQASRPTPLHNSVSVVGQLPVLSLVLVAETHYKIICMDPVGREPRAVVPARFEQPPKHQREISQPQRPKGFFRTCVSGQSADDLCTGRQRRIRVPGQAQRSAYEKCGLDIPRYRAPAPKTIGILARYSAYADPIGPG